MKDFIVKIKISAESEEDVSKLLISLTRKENIIWILPNTSAEKKGVVEQ